MSKWYCIVNNQQYGPVSEEVFRSWIQAGRIRPPDYVWCEGMPEWRPAGEVPGLFVGAQPAAIQPGGPQPPGTAPPGAATFPQVPPGPAGPQAYLGAVQRHRGGTILVLGILGLVCCVICGIIAWVMGSTDLRAMAAGRMDRSGEGMTRAGKICGIISVVLAIVGAIGYVLMIILQISLGVSRFDIRQGHF